MAIAVVVLPLLVVVGGVGLWKVAIGAVQRPFSILNALSVGVLMVLLIIAAYTGLFLAIATARF
jgi:hypothetical protein